MTLQFTRDLLGELDVISGEASKVVTQASLEMWRTAVDATPHDTYTAQNGWKLSRVRRGSYVPIRHVQSPPKRPNFRFRVTKDRRVYFWNNVKYVYYLEHGLAPGAGRVAHRMMQKGRKVFERSLSRGLRRIK